MRIALFTRSLKATFQRSDRFCQKAHTTHDGFLVLANAIENSLEEVRKMKQNFFVCLVVFVVALALALPAVAQDKKDKPKSEKIKNALLVKAAQPDPSGKFSTIAIQTDKGTFPVLKNAIAKKMEEHVGSRAELEAMPREVDGKKVYEVWTFSRTVEGQKPRRLPSE
jgi:hypothetical protein